ncbi:MAG: hypothetical protein J6C81_00025 [Muribaculaceae bacterium]|nr:hypothetical protein [Muribaculaceae bacterium]
MANLRHAHLGDLLNRAYELEGLLLLALSRRDSDEHINGLITSKIYEMADFTAEWQNDSYDKYRRGTASALDDENSSYSLEEDEEEEENVAEESAQVEDETVDNLKEEAEAAEMEEAEDADEEVTPVPELQTSEETQQPVEAINSGFMAEVNEAPEVAPRAEVYGPQENPEEKAADENTNSEHTVAAEVTAVEGISVTPAPTKSPQPRPVISINDRYLFTRELFHNSRQDFENCLNQISQMDNYDEAEDYFLNELELNPDKNEVRQFMDVIHRYFDALMR